MPKAQVELFLEKIKTDDELREKILEFEEKARANALRLAQETESNARANAYTITAIAKEAGFDISQDFFRQAKLPMTFTDKEIEAESCWSTCCWVATSCLHTCWWTN